MNYIQVSFSPLQDNNMADILSALLTDQGFEGFEEKEQELLAFISEPAFDQSSVEELAAQFSLAFTLNKIPAQNWNALWESNYAPVIVEDIVAVRASFHETIPSVQHEIVITPKMSFGTGHHATTWMMLKEMNKIDFTNKSVFDFGTGTGVLAIFAHLKKAKHIVANDIDSWSIENCKENFENNGLRHYSLMQAELAEMPNEEYDVILANINLNILTDCCNTLYKRLKTGGHILLSGIMPGDVDRLNLVYNKAGFNLITTENKDNWALMHYTKQ